MGGWEALHTEIVISSWWQDGLARTLLHHGQETPLHSNHTLFGFVFIHDEKMWSELAYALVFLLLKSDNSIFLQREEVHTVCLTETSNSLGLA